MGTREGFRRRKYHGFYLGIPGRSETAFLVDLDFECNGVPLWPHWYLGPEGPLKYPTPEDQGIRSTFASAHEGPLWTWHLADGILGFRVIAFPFGGIQLSWEWRSRQRKNALLKIRGLWGMRDLHGLGGQSWRWDQQNPEWGRVVTADGREAFCTLLGAWSWKDDPQWFQGFHYAEEVARGYPSDEDLFSAGILEVALKGGQYAGWVLTQDLEHIFEGSGPRVLRETNVVKVPKVKRITSRLSDFMLTEPVGVVAGFPWFGEWGRDTSISLPGIVLDGFHGCGTFKALDSDQKTVTKTRAIELWTYELLSRWGKWIESHGMLPNLIDRGGQPQWDSADATLWWCHSLAALWTVSLCPPYPFENLVQQFGPLLDRAVLSIDQGRHAFLKTVSSGPHAGLVEVVARSPNEAYTTWMDAKSQGAAVTPRLGCLPEINALWFEARTLQWLWNGIRTFAEIQDLGKKVLQCREPSRPNIIFLHSLPLAPSFVLQDWNALSRDVTEVAERFWTPAGLRSLSPDSAQFKARCIGNQERRDQAYHQGPVWAWLGGHFEMARHRLMEMEKMSQKKGESQTSPSLFSPHQMSKDKMFTSEVLEDMPIEGHIAEIFDADPPFTARGAPAQAWSLATVKEAHFRRTLRLDSRVTQLLARRWLGRKDRRKGSESNRPAWESPSERSQST